MSDIPLAKSQSLERLKRIHQSMTIHLDQLLQIMKMNKSQLHLLFLQLYRSSLFKLMKTLMRLRYQSSQKHPGPGNMLELNLLRMMKMNQTTDLLRSENLPDKLLVLDHQNGGKFDTPLQPYHLLMRMRMMKILKKPIILVRLNQQLGSRQYLDPMQSSGKRQH